MSKTHYTVVLANCPVDYLPTDKMLNLCSGLGITPEVFKSRVLPYVEEHSRDKRSIPTCELYSAETVERQILNIVFQSTGSGLTQILGTLPSGWYKKIEEYLNT